jgi:hypothetical protein
MGRLKAPGSTSGRGVAVVGTRHDVEEHGQRRSALPRFHPGDWPADTLREAASAYARAVAPTVEDKSPGAIAVAAAASWERFERTGSDLVFTTRAALEAHWRDHGHPAEPYRPPALDIAARLT